MRTWELIDVAEELYSCLLSWLLKQPANRSPLDNVVKPIKDRGLGSEFAKTGNLKPRQQCYAAFGIYWNVKLPRGLRLTWYVACLV